MITRRQFLKLAAGNAAGALLLLQPAGIRTVQAGQPAVVRRKGRTDVLYKDEGGPTLDPTRINKYVTSLIVPPAMPKSKRSGRSTRDVDYYDIALRQLRQQILPPHLPKTTVWGYGALQDPRTFNYPAFTIEATYNKPVRVRWINQLMDEQGRYLPHLLPVDPSLHWANPAGGKEGRDMRPTFKSTPGRYTGPVPMVVHVHGAHVAQEFDGYAEAWYLPDARNIPRKYARTGTFYDFYKPAAEEKLGQHWPEGSAIFEYPNDQRATTLWYHDHTLGMTRLNVYAGPAGFYLIRGGPDDLPAGVLPSGPYEVPIVIQDRVFNKDGSLFFPDSRLYFDEFEGPYIPGSDISPIWNPEFFGNTMVVNGRTWPKLAVERRRYRFRLLNGCNARFLLLRLVIDTPNGSSNLPFVQVGSEGGFLPAPVEQGQLLMALAERADVIVDFSGLKEGTKVYLINVGPDEPFGGGAPGEDFEPANPETTGQVMMFEVVRCTSSDKSVPADHLQLPTINPIQATAARQVSLNEMMSMVIAGAGPIGAQLGTYDVETKMPTGKMWMEPVTENPELNSSEVWEIFNFTADAHPIHIHQTMFQVVNRQRLEVDEEGVALQPAQLIDGEMPPEAWEQGFKDTVIAYPGAVTRIKAKFDLPGLYAWHCHIIDHEDNEMMRPYFVGPIPDGIPHIKG